ncbi:MAG: hypothetical protein L0Z50_38585 [Verrucomicrobiales bacterium]|nr:hypothetical protein [Verrucomicrobiales bacterium]
MWDNLCDVLMDFDYLQARIGVLTDGSEQLSLPAKVFDLLRDFQNALAALPDDHPLREQVAALQHTLDMNSYALALAPLLLVQQMYNTLAWDWDETTVLGQRIRDAARRYTRMWLKLLNRPVAATDPALLRTLAGHSDSVNSVAFSPDGKMVASVSEYNPDGGTVKNRHFLEVSWWDAVAFSLWGTGHSRIGLYDAQTGELLTWLPCADTVMTFWFSPNSRELCVADSGGAAGVPNVYVLECGF